MHPLTLNIPKPMVRVCDKNLIEHNFWKLPKEVDEVIIVVHYLSEQIINHFGEEFHGKKITYVRQKKLLGTGHALFACKEYLKNTDRFIVMMADDIYGENDIKNAVKKEGNVLTVKKINGKFRGGNVIFDQSNILKDIKEGIHKGKKSFVNVGFYILSPEIFNYDLVKIENSKEYGLPQTIIKMTDEYKINIVEFKEWFQVVDMVDIKILKRKLCKKR